MRILFLFCTCAFLFLTSCNDADAIQGFDQDQLLPQPTESALLHDFQEVLTQIVLENNTHAYPTGITTEALIENVTPELLDQYERIATQMADLQLPSDLVAEAMQKAGMTTSIQVHGTQEKGTPCHDAHEARMAQVSAAAAVCLASTVYTGTIPGALLCIVGYESSRLASESTLRKCINRKY